MLFRKTEKAADAFWQEYEEKLGEKVLARGLGKYVSGWDEFDNKKWGGIWGLIIATSGGFRFHHFPQMTWIDAFTRFAAQEQPKEKTIFIPKEKIISAELIKGTNLWKKIFSYTPPQLVIRYTDETSAQQTGEKRLLLEAEYKADDLPGKLFSGDS
ncbi:MAG: hypothetical protein LBH44_08245 [Treponema sp.]|jgi:hypothetical protein|nr:hypothetical protein [Treponema sp.]